MRLSRDMAVDLVAALSLAAVAQLEVWAPTLVPSVPPEVDGNRWLLSTTSLVATLPLAVRRLHPLTVLLVVLAAMVTQQLLTVPTEGLTLMIAALVAAYSASAYAPLSRGLVAGAALLVSSAFIGEDGADWAFIAVVLGNAWLLGLVGHRQATDLTRARGDNRTLAERLAAATAQLAEAQARSGQPVAPDGLSKLTPREVEVARAVARGMTNAEIAEALVISEWTVKTHVASILRKLGLRDRAQVVVAAYESGLVRPHSGR